MTNIAIKPKREKKPVRSVASRVWICSADDDNMTILCRAAGQLGTVRRDLWREHGSGVHPTNFNEVKKAWLKNGRFEKFEPMSSNLVRETINDVMGDIKARLESAKQKARKNVHAFTDDAEIRHQMYLALKSDTWMNTPQTHRWMRRQAGHGVARSLGHILIRSDRYYQIDKTLFLKDIVKGEVVQVNLPSHFKLVGNLRLILREGGVIELHHRVESRRARPCGERTIGIDKGYTEAFCDSDGQRYGLGFGDMLTKESDRRSTKNARRAKLREQAKLNPKIEVNNLGKIKYDKQKRRADARQKNVINQAVNQIFDKASHVAVEDLRSPIKSKKKFRKSTTRHLSSWTKGAMATSIESVAARRGGKVTLVNAAYTSQVDPKTRGLARRANGRLYCPTSGEVVFDDDDWAASIEILARLKDPQIKLFMSYTDVKKVIESRSTMTGHTACLGPNDKQYPSFRSEIAVNHV